MNYSIRKLLPADSQAIEQVCELLNTSYEPLLAGFFMYRDRNYKRYLANSLIAGGDALYATISGQGDVMGFAQVKISDSGIFLNNIIIKPAFRGYHLASGLLRFIVADVTKDQPDIRTFGLDVFEKNVDVLNWYFKLGLQVQSSRYWYDLTDHYFQSSGTTAPERIELIMDQSGFVQVYSGDIRVGTLINGENLVMRSEVEASVLNSLRNNFKSELKGLCLITPEQMAYPLIDRSLQLQVALADLKLNSKV